MPFGLHNAAQTFQRFIDKVLHGLHFAYAYIDDVLIASTSAEEHKRHLKLVFQRFHDYGVVIHPDKCDLGKASLNYLGHLIDKDGIRPMDSKVTVVREFPCPTSQRQLHRFLGMMNFYHRFLPNSAAILYPLHAFLPHTQSKNELQWSDTSNSAFNHAKEPLAQAALLYHHKSDALIAIMTDASDLATGAVLQQFINQKWQPISYYSRKLSPAERKYSTFDRELLAVYRAIKHFRHFVEGHPFQYILTTSH